jgi:phosphate transport system substrate-binding protein
MRTELRAILPAASIFAFALLATSCTREEAASDGEGGEALTGAIAIDGSSTVYPIAEAVAEEFMLANPEADVTVGFAGTGGGFKRFCGGETDIANASRPITEEERTSCTAAGIDFVEIPVAWDGLAVLVNPANNTVQCLTKDELKKIWEPNSTVQSWRNVRPDFPDTKISLYGPGTDSGTFDYFTEAVVGTAKSSRADYQASEDDNILVQGVAGDAGALGYFGYAYYSENQDRLKLVAVDGGAGCVLPSDATIADSTYPLSRPLFIYVKRAALEKPVVKSFVQFFMDHAPELVPATGYHPLSAEQYRQNAAGI